MSNMWRDLWEEDACGGGGNFRAGDACGGGGNSGTRDACGGGGGSGLLTT